MRRKTHAEVEEMLILHNKDYVIRYILELEQLVLSDALTEVISKLEYRTTLTKLRSSLGLRKLPYSIVQICSRVSSQMKKDFWKDQILSLCYFTSARINTVQLLKKVLKN